jgi:hypothetical protein
MAAKRMAATDQPPITVGTSGDGKTFAEPLQAEADQVQRDQRDYVWERIEAVLRRSDKGSRAVFPT